MESINIQNQQLNLVLKISSTVQELESDWRKIAGLNIFAKPEYLLLLENQGPIGFSYYYAILYKDNEPFAAIYFQRKRVELEKDFRIHAHSNNLWQKFRIGFLKQFFKLVKHEILICGNVLLTGEYAFGNISNIPLDKTLFDLVFEKVVKFVHNHDGVKVQSILCKDFYVSGKHKLLNFSASGFFEFHVQPCMILDINDNWDSLEDYISDVKSKYRVKFKKVIKKGDDLEYVILDLEGARIYNDQMYALYKSTADRATFSLFYLHENYFYRLKETLGDNLNLTAVFKENELVGFYTFVKDYDQGDAHFIGYDVTLNSEYQIYFNMLLKLIEAAILNKSKYLNLSRTALEIKSSVGAEPYDMFVYIKHLNPIINKVIPKLLNWIVPKNDWEQRSPFK